MTNNTQLMSGIDDPRWNLVFWLAEELDEKEFACHARNAYTPVSNRLMVAHANNPEFVKLMDAAGVTHEEKVEFLNEALKMTSCAYTKYTAVYSDNKEWLSKYFSDMTGRKAVRITRPTDNGADQGRVTIDNTMTSSTMVFRAPAFAASGRQ